MKKGNLDFNDIDYICVNFNVNYNFFNKLLFFKKYFKHKFFSKINAITKRQDIKTFFRKFSVNIEAKIINVPHHLSHIASAYLCSGFEKSLGV